MIPILIICHNNHIYVDNTVKQLIKINKDYKGAIIIVNNASTDPNTISYLEKCEINIIQNANNGPWIAENCNKHIYDILPDKFILTDPDLQFNENLPSNFVDIMSLLSDQYNCYKIGFALDISDFEKMYQTKTYVKIPSCSIYEWEKQFWENKIHNDVYELYNATIDTTFCLINKNCINDFNIRIAGNFIAKHLPWYIINPLINYYDNYILNCNSTIISTISRINKEYTDTTFHKIYKHDEFFLIKKDELDRNINFWKDVFPIWEEETFNIFDKFLDKNKVFIDIGGWIGTTCMYGGRKSKEVFVVEADTESFSYLTKNCKANNNNITCINKAIYNQSDIDISFGKNKFLQNSSLNDSTSQIYTENSADCYTIQCIRAKDLIKRCNIDITNISLIKVDIEGGEEHILNDLYELYNVYHISMYISFHYSWWQNKDLDRFEWLTSGQKQNILNYPFTSIMFE